MDGFDFVGNFVLGNRDLTLLPPTLAAAGQMIQVHSFCPACYILQGERECGYAWDRGGEFGAL